MGQSPLVWNHRLDESMKVLRRISAESDYQILTRRMFTTEFSKIDRETYLPWFPVSFATMHLLAKSSFPYSTTVTVTVVIRLPSLNVIVVLPAFFLALMVNTASPFSSVLCFFGDIFIIFLPPLSTLAFIMSPSARQPPSPVTDTFTSPSS